MPAILLQGGGSLKSTFKLEATQLEVGGCTGGGERRHWNIEERVGYVHDWTSICTSISLERPIGQVTYSLP